MNDCMMVPTLLISEFFDAEPDWDGQTRTVTMKKDDIIIKLTVGSDIMKVNGKDVKMKTKTQIIGGTTMSPIGQVAEVFGATVELNKDREYIVIKK